MRKNTYAYLFLLIAIMASCNSETKESTEAPKADFDVIIIGAGAAGMYAARELDKNGKKVQILEASSTHGGRAQYNNNFGNGFLSIGPEEVYPSYDFPVPMRVKAMNYFKELAVEEGKDPESLVVKGDKVYIDDKIFATLPDSGRTKIDIYRDLYEWDSTLLHPFEIGEEFSFAFHDDSREDWGDWPYKGNDYENAYHMGLKNIVYMKDGKRVNAQDDDSYGEAIEALSALWRYRGPDTTQSAILEMELGIKEGDILWTLIEDLVASGTSASSLNHMYSSRYSEAAREFRKAAREAEAKDGDKDEEEEEWGHWYSDPGGNVFYVDLPYKQFLDSLYFQVLHDKNLIKYDAPVVKVDYTNDIIVVTDENGETYTANKVISTVSVEVLKSEMIEFVPKLSAKKVEAYNKMAMDVGFRMYLKFKEPIWDKDEIVEILGAGYSSRCWVPAKFRSPEAGDPNILQCYIMGERAEQLLALDEDMADVVVKEMDAVFGGRIATDNFVESFYMNYKMNPYIGGIYSYSSTTGWYNDEGEGADDILVETVDGKIYFAGEATWSSTVVGAMRSGLRSAEEILEAETEVVAEAK
ncbi:MAG: FAD-dependent oxidoreductase [Flavobacteriales bacterium]|nr:FAD-dependent oxidoreductase [Flavobacteriales bacterium]